MKKDNNWEKRVMRKLTLGILGLIMTLAALTSAPKPAQGQTICPFCAIGFHCCIVGNQAKCLPDQTPCP
jgi:hypothetical protein